MRRILLVLAVVALSVCLEGVEELTDENFNEKVYGEPKLWLVMFSASWVPFFPRSAATAPTSNPKSKDWPQC